MTKIHALMNAYMRAGASVKMYVLIAACVVFTPIGMALLQEATQIIA